MQRWNVFDVLEMDAEKEKKKRRVLDTLEYSDLIPKRENIERQIVCFDVANKDPIIFKTLYEEWLYSEVYRLYVIKIVQNRLEKEQYNAE